MTKDTRKLTKILVPGFVMIQIISVKRMNGLIMK